ncbi:hypothetical protein XU18_3746 [Perkinsela sp. CCAP 1560/4]|nr:hypothetical protein XU18_3746 [Perkinsela sp. CCAP 1560/4]|eukprot:KNH05183.1 hypothetical protein XU18_3746 [Perkinsela sp. CCAP 1560/4]
MRIALILATCLISITFRGDSFEENTNQAESQGGALQANVALKQETVENSVNHSDGADTEGRDASRGGTNSVSNTTLPIDNPQSTREPIFSEPPISQLPKAGENSDFGNDRKDVAPFEADVNAEKPNEPGDIREEFFGSTGYEHVKKHLKKPTPPKPKKNPASPAKISSINRITAGEIYSFVLRSLNESFRIMNKRCKCYGPDVWLGSFPYESSEEMVLLKHYRHLIKEYSYHVIQRGKYCGCIRSSENAAEKAEETFVNGLSPQVLLPHLSESHTVTKLEFYRSMLALEPIMKKAVGKCCLRSTGDAEGTDPDVSTCHIT